MSSPPESPQLCCEHALAMVISDCAEALRLADAVLTMPAATAADHALAHGVAALSEFRLGEEAKGQQRMQASAQALQSAGPVPRVADLLDYASAHALRMASRLDEAHALLQGLHRRARERPAVDAYFTASALGTVLTMRGEDNPSLDMYYQALALARQSQVDSLLVNALNNLGSLQSDLYNLEDALPLLEECLAGAVRLGSRRQIIYAAGNLAQCLCLAGEAARALEIARLHLIGHIHADDPPALQRDEEIAQVLLENGLVDEAEKTLGGPAHVDLLTNDMATNRVWLGARVLLARSRSDEALQLCLGHQARLRERGEEGIIAIDHVNLCRLAAEAAHRTGDQAQAYAQLSEAYAQHEQLLGRAARSRQLSLQITHRLQHTEWERDAARQMAERLEALNTTLQAQVGENERLQERLRAQALEDPLTGLHNRRHLMDAGAALLALMARRCEPLAVVLVDLDHFKRVNDEHGHDAGDRVLCGFAALAREQTRAEDLACRYGGEEFVLLLPGANADQARTRLNQLLQQFSAMRFENSAGETFSCSFSAGVAVAASSDDLLADLLSQADAALYRAKATGRACVALATAG